MCFCKIIFILKLHNYIKLIDDLLTLQDIKIRSRGSQFDMLFPNTDLTKEVSYYFFQNKFCIQY